MKLIKEGSVKSIYSDEDGKHLFFKFSDRYSIFDWGEMPDLIEGKGEALLWYSKFFFEFFEGPETWRNWSVPKKLENSTQYKILKTKGLDHHYRGIVDNKFLKVQATQVLEPPFQGGEYNYSAYQKRPMDALVPLEVVFRFGLPEGSSFYERADDKDYLAELGVDELPSQEKKLKVPIIEFSSKLESSDRYMSYSEARKISGLSQEEWQNLLELNLLLACRLKDCFKDAGLDLWDGKFEWSMKGQGEIGPRLFQLVDSIGPDEIRLVYKGMPLSKELLRQFYRNTSWKKALDKVKQESKDNNDPNWKKNCLDQGILPMPLEGPQKEVALGLYSGIAHQLANAHGCDCQLMESSLEEVFNKWESLC